MRSQHRRTDLLQFLKRLPAQMALQESQSDIRGHTSQRSFHFTSTWHIFIARSASSWLSTVTPAQQEASTDMRFSG